VILEVNAYYQNKKAIDFEINGIKGKSLKSVITNEK
jgi:hypothetical protein